MNASMSNISTNKYFDWLVGLVGGPDHNYETLLDRLFKAPFNVRLTHERDDNRMEDALYLRAVYEDELGTLTYMPPGMPSVLEGLIGIAMRLDETAYVDSPGGYGTEYWFWVLIENLELDGYVDTDRWSTMVTEIDSIIYSAVYRMYDSSGYGGFFPLSTPAEDQRQIEIWYQMMAWLNDNTPISDV